MKRMLIVLILSLMIAVTSPVQGTPQKSGAGPKGAKETGSLPTVERILDRYVQAIGGAAAFRKLTSRITRTAIEIQDSNVTFSLVSYAQAPNKHVQIGQVRIGNDIEFEISRGFNGTAGWSLNRTEGGFRELSGSELALEKRDAEFYRETRLRELYPKMVLKGEVDVGGHTTYCIEATPLEGSAEKWFFEPETGLLVRRDYIFESVTSGKVPIETYFEDYREVDGIKLPFTIRVPADKSTYKVIEVRHNLPIEEARFKSPGAAFDALSTSRVRSPSPPSTGRGVLYLSFEPTGNRVSIRAALDGNNKTYTLPQAAEIPRRLRALYALLKDGELTKDELNPLLEDVGAVLFHPITALLDSAAEIQFIIPGQFLIFPLDLLHFKGRPLFLQKPVSYSFERLESGQFLLSPEWRALILSDKSADPENGCQVLKQMLPASSYYDMEDINLEKLASIQASDLLLISAHGSVGFANTDSMAIGKERLQPEHLSHLSPRLVYLDSCSLGVSASFIQSFRERGTKFYVAPIFSNEAGNSSTRTIALFFGRLKAGDTPSKALFLTRKQLYEFYGAKEGFNMLLFRAFPFRVYLLN